MISEMKLLAVLLGLVSLCYADKKAVCREVRPKMMTCLEGTAADLPKTPQPHLEWLVLTRYNWAVLKKDQLVKFPGLTDFHAEKAQIERIEDNAFKSLQILDWVDLSQNKLSAINPDTFDSNPRLHQLNISLNPLAIPENRPFLNSPQLKWLDIQNSKISKVYPTTFRGLPKLEILNLAFNQLDSLPDGVFQHQTKLSSLYLNGNKFQSVSQKVFQPLKPLVLFLADNPWSCDCALLPTIQWTKKNLVKDETKCVKPDNKKWAEITTMKSCEPIK